MKEEKISVHRVIPILGMLVSAAIAAGVLCYVNQLEIDQIICVAFLVISFMPIIIFELTFERRREMLGNNNQTTFRRAMNGFFICSMITLGISFLPEYFYIPFRPAPHCRLIIEPYLFSTVCSQNS